MANTVTKNTLRPRAVTELIVSNGATASLNNTSHVVLLDKFEVRYQSRVTIQIRNVDNSNILTVAAWGSLFPAPGTEPTSTTPADSKWVQIGDDITASASSGAIKTISTTGLIYLAITAQTDTGAVTFPADDCIVFGQEI